VIAARTGGGDGELRISYVPPFSYVEDPDADHIQTVMGSDVNVVEMHSDMGQWNITGPQRTHVVVECYYQPFPPPGILWHVPIELNPHPAIAGPLTPSKQVMASLEGEGGTFGVEWRPQRSSDSAGRYRIGAFFRCFTTTAVDGHYESELSRRPFLRWS
jgi:hypothetical protein